MARKRSSRRSKAAANDWSPDVPANNQTWMYLFMKEQILTSFPDSRELKMQQMKWWNGLATPAVRRIDAEKLAIEIHRFFRDSMKRPYEDAFAQNGFALAIPALTDTLVIADETIPTLAGVVNRIFRFKGE